MKPKDLDFKKERVMFCIEGKWAHIGSYYEKGAFKIQHLRKMRKWIDEALVYFKEQKEK